MRAALLLLLVGCRSGNHPARAETASGAPDKPPAPACDGTPRTLAAGLTVERTAVAADAGGGCVTLVRVEPARWQLRLDTALAEGGPRPAPGWARDFNLVGVINASMFAETQRSIGLLVSGDVVNNGGDNPKLGAFLAFDPVDPADPAVTLAGRDCPGFDLAALRRRYRSIVQNYRILDCDGKAIPWKDPKRFSAAAVAMDTQGRVVFVHSRAPHRMADFARHLAAPELGLTAAMYVEGGPEASLYVATAADTVSEVGSYESGFFDTSNTEFWRIPNVIGFAPRRE